MITLPGTYPRLLQPGCPILLQIHLEDDDQVSLEPGILLSVEKTPEGDLDTFGYYYNPKLGLGRYYAAGILLVVSCREGLARASIWLLDTLGYDSGVCPPLWYRLEGGEYPLWVLETPDIKIAFFSDYGKYFVGEQQISVVLDVPGLDKVSDPYEAMQLCCQRTRKPLY